MRATSVIGFVLLGAVGFGIGGAIGTFMFPLGLLLGGALGGAALGLALKDFRRVVILALLSALGLFVGVMAGLTLGAFFNYPEVPIAAFIGVAVGASLGVALRHWRTIVALAVVGGAGFSVGLLVGGFLQNFLPIRMADDITITGAIGGASLGAALSYLEYRKQAREQQPRVR